MTDSYWSKFASSRISRRRVLAASAASAAGLSLLAACGGGDGEGGGGTSTGLLTAPQDTSKSAKPGGTFRSFITADAPTLSPETGAASSRVVVWRCYSRLTAYPTSYLDKSYIPGEPAADLAESWEISGDKLQITFKINPQAKWDSRAPTNSRAVDAQDVAFSWEKFLALNSNRNNLANSLNAAAPVSSVQAIDQRTVVVKTAFPSVDVFDAMAVRFFIMPRELDGGFDARTVVRGSSPWILSEYQPSVGFTFQKNPNWYRKDRPFMEKVEVPIIPEYAQRLAQFRAGSIFWTDIRDEDILPTKRDLPALALHQEDFTDSALEVRFGLASADSPFWDARVRRAVSMLIDRELYARTFSAIDAYKKEGISVETRWANIAGFKQAIEPRDKDFGPSAVNYKYDVAEAKKLLTAAGFANGMSIDAPRTQTDSVPRYDAILGMLKDGGINTNVKIWNATTEFTPRVFDRHGDFDGIAFHPAAGWPLIDSLVRRYASAGAQFPRLRRNWR